jgi:homoserine O-acetyltransferase/O-succinyltransferase
VLRGVLALSPESSDAKSVDFASTKNLSCYLRPSHILKLLGDGMRKAILAVAALAAASLSNASMAADYPAAKEGDWVAREFKFHTGEIMPEVRLHYRTVGEPSGQRVLLLHGTSGSGAGMLTNAFAGELFGADQPLDASKHFIILPDALGAGKSSKPSDGLRTKFPRYNSEDIVEAQYRLVTEGLGIRHLRLVLGNSGGGMQTWLWGEKYPGFMDVLVPMASQPTPMASRNWMLRRMMIETIRSDPEWNGGNYGRQPQSLRLANAFFGIATSGGTLAYQKLAPTREKADKLVDDRLAGRPDADANDLIYQYDSARDYDPSSALERIEAALLAINSADDERNPPETGITERAIKRVKNGRLYLIPAGEETRGHGTTGNAKFYSRELRELLQTAPNRAM